MRFRPSQRDDLPALAQTRSARSVAVGLIAAGLHATRTALWFLGLLSLVLVLTAGVMDGPVMERVISLAKGIFARAVRGWRTDRTRVRASQPPRTESRTQRRAPRPGRASS